MAMQIILLVKYILVKLTWALTDVPAKRSCNAAKLSWYVSVDAYD